MQNSLYTVETVYKAFDIGDSKKQQTQTLSILIKTQNF